MIPLLQSAPGLRRSAGSMLGHGCVDARLSCDRRRPAGSAVSWFPVYPWGRIMYAPASDLGTLNLAVCRTSPFGLRCMLALCHSASGGDKSFSQMAVITLLWHMFAHLPAVSQPLQMAFHYNSATGPQRRRPRTVQRSQGHGSLERPRCQGHWFRPVVLPAAVTIATLPLRSVMPTPRIS